MSSILNRRNFLIIGLGTATTVLSGCMGNGQEQNGQQQNTPNNQNQPNTEDENNEETTQFGDTVRFGDSFAVESNFEDQEGNQVTTTGRFYQGDFYYRIEMDQQTMELYNIDGENYLVDVENQTCMVGANQQIDPSQGGLDPEAYQSDTSEHPNITPTGRTTIDGEEMHIFEISNQDNQNTTYYVSVNTGYLRRVETQDHTINFHSWNDVDPINQPNMDCQEMPQGQMPQGQNSYYGS